jgi:PTS system mannose-specific IIC component
MQITVFQIIALTIYSFVGIYDALETDIGLSRPIFAGLFAGLVMGDVKLGLEVGATLQLMILGIGTYGGASIPDYMTAALLGTMFGVLSGKGLTFAIGLAVPIGLLLVELDVLARFTNTIFQHRADKYAKVGDIKGIERMNILGVLPWGLSRAIPTFLACIFGSTICGTILNYLPTWLMNGLKTSGGILPVVGIAILLKFLPTKRYIAYLIVGFVAAAYLKVPMVGVALVGLALAFIEYQKSEHNTKTLGGATEDE